MKKLLFERKLNLRNVSLLKNPTFINLNKFAINYSDAIIQGSKNINPQILKYIKKSKLPFMPYAGDEEYEDTYNNFFESLVSTEELELSEK